MTLERPAEYEPIDARPLTLALSPQSRGEGTKRGDSETMTFEEEVQSEKCKLQSAK